MSESEVWNFSFDTDICPSWVDDQQLVKY